MSAFRRVMVAIDGSPMAARALDLAATLATACDAELVVAHAVGLLEEQGLHNVGIDERVAEIEAQVEQWCGSLREAGVDHRIEVAPGSPVPALLITANRVGADLIVVGTRGLGGASRLGSTSEGLVLDAEVPVLVVPTR